MRIELPGQFQNVSFSVLEAQRIFFFFSDLRLVYLVGLLVKLRKVWSPPSPLCPSPRVFISLTVHIGPQQRILDYTSGVSVGMGSSCGLLCLGFVIPVSCDSLYRLFFPFWGQRFAMDLGSHWI